MLRHLFAVGISNKAKLKFPVIMYRGRRDIRIAAGAVIDRFASLLCDRNSQITVGAGTYVGSYSVLKTYRGRISLGSNCSLNAFCFINGAGGVSIGDNVRIAAHCSIIASNHRFDDLAKPIRLQGTTSEGIVIEDDVWVGTGVRILDGVCIGHGAVIAAGAVVTKSVAQYSVVAGVPARPISNRAE